MEGSEFKRAWEIEMSVWVVTGLQPGSLYNVTVTPTACRNQTTSVHILVKTDAQILEATAHLTNVEFTGALQFPTSQEYQNLSRSVLEQILQSLPDDILALVTSGHVRVLITGLAPGSVIVNFTVIMTPSQFHDILNVTSVLMEALQNSSTYTVDANQTYIHDVNECSTENIDCSSLATCFNTWGSFSCVCLQGYTDLNPSRPGRVCSAILTNPSPEQTSTTPAIRTTTSQQTTSENSPLTGTNTPDVHTAETTTMDAGHTPFLQCNASICLTHLVCCVRAISVMCRVSSITVMVQRGFLEARHIMDSSLYLGRQRCGQNEGNSSHVQMTVPWDDCDTELLHNNTHYTAKTTLFTSNDPQSLANDSTMLPALHVPVICTFERSILISPGVIPTRYDMINTAVMGSGTFHVTVQLLNGTSPIPQNYSLETEDEVLVSVRVNSTDDKIKVIINKCWVTQSNDPLEPSTYVFLENSCPITNTFTTILENGISNTSRFSLRVFSYVNLNVIYLHCHIQICMETALDNCYTKCIERTERLSNLIGMEKASCGPLFRSHQGKYSFKM
ncbi:hypothetical protein DPEC_G00240190 [Dallia pectoralis]|uniref:Uncharacterized protein n=1 Tax=Dallia pectoralis TaxID=75939 RepID=A0ACC2FZ45_DALPE|nr:hypothetical protein DPEC_G00240190 [Dallia pectoralis]